MAIFLLLAWHLNTVTEDAFISFRFARNLAEGYGFRWNLHQLPVEGFTNFAWTLILSAAYKLGMELEIVSRAMGILFALLTLAVSWKIVERYSRADGWWKYIGVGFLAAAPPLASWASSGLETTMFTFLVTWGIYFYLRSGEESKYIPWWGVILLLAALTRPEGLIFFIIIALHSFITRGVGRKTIVPVILFVIPFALFEIWRITYFGDYLPNTFYAKTGFTSAMLVRGVKYVVKFFLVTGTPILGLLMLIKPGRPYGLLLSVCGFYLMYVTLVGGDYMHYFRFVVPILPLLMLLAGEGVNRLRLKRKYPAYALGGVCGALMLFGAFYPFGIKPSVDVLSAKPLYYVCGRPMLLFERYQVARLKLLGEAFAGVQRPGESLATSAIGIIGHKTALAVHDFHGLTDRHVAKMENPSMGHGDLAHEKIDFAYTMSLNPTYVMFTREFKHYPMERREMLQHIVAVGVWGDIETGFKLGELDSLLADYEVVNWWLKDEGNAGYYPLFVRKGRFQWDGPPPRRPRLPLKPPHGIPDRLPDDWEEMQKERMRKQRD